MSTTEDYLDQLLRSASGAGNDDTGELDSELQSEENIIPLESSIEEDKSTFEDDYSLEQTMEMPSDEGLSLEQAMEMSVDDVLNEMENQGDNVEIESHVEVSEDNNSGMMSEEAIADMLAASESEEAESTIVEPEEPFESAIEEDVEAETPEDNNNEMMSEEAIAAMFAANESAEAVDDAEELVPLEDSLEPVEEPAEISLDDMLADMREETSEAMPEDFSILSEETEVGEQPEIEAESEADSEGSDSILDLLNMMSEDEDLKDIGDLLKSDEDSYFNMSDDELFNEPSAEDEGIQQEPEEIDQGFFGKLFGTKKAETGKMKNDENEQIIKEVEEEIKEEDHKAEKKSKKKKSKKEKSKKNVELKGSEEEQEGEEGKESQSNKKRKKEKKKKEKKVKTPKEKEILPKEPPLPKKPVILIMLMAASILALVLISNRVIDYQSTISKADSSFINRNYEQAYENIIGVNVKEEDKQLYDRIRVMMKLEAKYNMYLSHIEQNEYDEALNDLIMGVIKYDQYKKEAEELGISQAFDDELALIEEQLNVVFGVDADQARNWYHTLSALDYTEMVRNVVKAAGYTVEESETEETSNDLSQFGVEEVE